MSFLWSIYLASKRSWRLGLLPLDTHFKNQGKVLNKENWLLLKEFYDNHRNHPVHGINIKNLDCWSSLHNDEINYSVIRTKIILLRKFCDSIFLAVFGYVPTGCQYICNKKVQQNAIYFFYANKTSHTSHNELNNELAGMFF